jgi:hypothetical protein
MRQQSSFFVVLLMAGLIVITAGIAGCTSQAPSSTQASDKTPVPTTTSSAIDPANLVVQPSEFPGNYTLVEERERSPSELSEWALGHGWTKGYYVLYQKDNPASSSVTILRQNISVYSGENATLAVSDTLDGMADWLAGQGGVNNTSVEKLALGTIGDASGSLKYSDKRDNSTMYVIAVAKNGVFLDVETNGTAADYTIAQQLANITAAKIR